LGPLESFHFPRGRETCLWGRRILRQMGFARSGPFIGEFDFRASFRTGGKRLGCEPTWDNPIGICPLRDPSSSLFWIASSRPL